MNSLQIILTVLACLALAGVCYLWAQGFLRPRLVPAWNGIATGTRSGPRTFSADAALTTRYLLVAHGAGANRIAICGLNGIPWGIATDEAAAAGDLVAVALLGGTEGTLKGVSAGAISIGDFVIPAANGQLRTLTGAPAGNHYICGRAIEATTGANEEFEFVPYSPTLRTI